MDSVGRQSEFVGVAAARFAIERVPHWPRSFPIFLGVRSELFDGFDAGGHGEHARDFTDAGIFAMGER